LSYGDCERSRKALQEGESILAQDCVGHNYFAFYRTAMETSLWLEDWDEVNRYASALEAYCKPEPLARCEFYISRGRVIAKLGRDGRDQQTLSRLAELRKQAEEVGLIAAIPAMDAALAG
jgi:hypothetical protein